MCVCVYLVSASVHVYLIFLCNVLFCTVYLYGDVDAHVHVHVHVHVPVHVQVQVCVCVCVRQVGEQV